MKGLGPELEAEGRWKIGWRDLTFMLGLQERETVMVKNPGPAAERE